MKSLNKRKTMVLVLAVLFLILITTISTFLRDYFFNSYDGVSLWITLLEVIGVLGTIIIAIMQLRDSKEISRATFIVELNRTFVENPDYTEIYNALQNCLDKKCTLCENSGCDVTHCEIHFEKSKISNYLTFFETIYILYKKEVISFDIIDDLFAYRFFLAVHSRLIQQEKLMPQPENFKNIFLLEREWLDYRIKHGRHTQAELDGACEKYRKALETDGEAVNEVEWENVYMARPLKAIVSEEKYKKITGK